MHLDREANGKNVGRREVRSSGVTGGKSLQSAKRDWLRGLNQLRRAPNSPARGADAPELLTSRLLNTLALFHHCVDRWLRRVLGFLARSEWHRRGP
jgi:hypothetical protein